MFFPFCKKKVLELTLSSLSSSFTRLGYGRNVFNIKNDS